MTSPQPHSLWRVAALAMMTPDRLSVALQGESAALWVAAAAKCGIAEAQVRLGRLLLEGDGIARNSEAAAFTSFQSAADNGDAEGNNMLGRCYENGWGTDKDFAAAARHYRIAAEAGLDWAQYNLGHMLLSGSGVARDRDAAFRCYSLAAARGHVRAMNLVGRCHEEGWGVLKDPAKARSWYRRSAQGGYFRGAYNYADTIAAEGCVHGALYWFARALATAPPPTHTLILRSLSRRAEPRLRELARAFNRTDRSARRRPGPHAPEACA